MIAQEEHEAILQPSKGTSVQLTLSQGVQAANLI